MSATLPKLWSKEINHLKFYLWRLPQTLSSKHVCNISYQVRQSNSTRSSRHSFSLLPISKSSSRSGQGVCVLSHDCRIGRWANIAAIVAAAYALDVTSTPNHAECDANNAFTTYEASNNDLSARIARFKDWLGECGGDMSALGLAPTSEALGSGLGVFVTKQTWRCAGRRAWWDPRGWISWGSAEVPLAAFPLSLTITARRALEDPLVGTGLAQLLHSGLADERVVVMLYLMIEDMKGASSEWAPWMELLPRRFTTPLFYGERELEELRGTTLYYAKQGGEGTAGEAVGGSADTSHPHLPGRRSAWAPSLLPPLLVGLRDLLSFPEPLVDGPRGAAPGQIKQPGGHRTRLGFLQPPNGSRLPLDHLGRPPLEAQPGSSGEPGVTDRHCASGEERKHPLSWASDLPLIMETRAMRSSLASLYGFTLDGNPNDVLMVRCPLPSAAQISADPTLMARLRLLALRGLTPQIFLPAQGLGTLGTRVQGTPRGWRSWLWSVVASPREGGTPAQGMTSCCRKAWRKPWSALSWEASHVTALLEALETPEGTGSQQPLPIAGPPQMRRRQDSKWQC
eukprot:jgi/Botrbrau1/3470/Bobra.341_2s0002.1